MPLTISVIIPVYNAERYVEQAVCSALEQPETGEVLLVEDGSPDGSLAVCERLAEADERVQLLRHPNGENRGAGESRNVGLRAARCELVAFLDADDYYLPGRFERALALLAADAQADGVYEGVGTHFETEEAQAWWRQRGRPDLTTVEHRVTDPDDLFESLLQGVGFCTDGIVVRRSLVARVGEFDPALRMCQDTAMWLKMAAAGRLVPGRLDEAVAMRRVHGENRIVRDQGLHEWYKLRMGWLMLRWCQRRGLEPRKMRAMVEYLLRSHRREVWRRRGPVARRFSDAAALGRVLWYYPGGRRSASFREIASRLLPWQWVVRRFGAGRAAEIAGNDRS